MDGHGAIPDTIHVKPQSLVLEIPPHIASGTDGNGAIPDTVQVKPKSIVMEIPPHIARAGEDGNGAIPDTVQVKPKSIVMEIPPHIARAGEDGNGAIPDTVQVKPKSIVMEIPPHIACAGEDGNGAIPDTVQVKPKSIVMEIPSDIACLKPDGNGAIPDTVQVKPQSMVLEIPTHVVNAETDGNGAIPDTVQTKAKSVVLEVPAHLACGGDGAIPDTVHIQSNSVVLEVPTPMTLSSHDGNGAIPDTVSVLPQSLVLDVPERLACGGYWQTGSVVSDQVKEKQQNRILTHEQLDFWAKNGYLVIEDAFWNTQPERLVANISDVIERLFQGSNPEQLSHYMQAESADLRPNGRLIVTLANDTIDMTLPPIQRIRRIGTGVHRLMPLFRAATFNEKNRQIALDLGFDDPRVAQSQIITKAAKVGGEVIPHQDGCSIFTDPPSGVTFWYALEEATATNGCLMVVPGSHKTTPLTRRCRVDEKGYPQFVPLEKPLFAQKIADDNNSKSNPELDTTYRFEKLEVKAGTLILMHGNLLHASEANRSDKNRMAYNFGVVDGGIPWLPDNFLQPYEGETEFEKLGPQ